MPVLKLVNLANDSTIIEETFTEEEMAVEYPLWQIQVELNKLDGIESRLDVIVEEE